MAQYTTSLKALIELDAYKEGILPYQLTIDNYITRGRKLFFNFSYAGDTVFKQYFEQRFITKYLLENINSDYPPLWTKNLELVIQTTAPLYYLKYQGLNQLTIDKMLSDGIRITEIKKQGDSDTANESNANSTDTGNGQRTSTGSGSGSSTNVNSNFPFNVASGTSVTNTNYKSDGGKVESSNTATDTMSEQNSKNRTESQHGHTEHNYNDSESINEKMTGNLLDKVMKLYSIDFNPIESFINEIYSKLFMLCW